jgi:hypothetical protein
MSPLLLSRGHYSAPENVRQGSAEKFRDAHNCHIGVIRGVIAEIDKFVINSDVDIAAEKS